MLGNSSQKNNFNIIFKSIIGGAIGGSIEVFANHPLWTLKTRLQNDKIPKNLKFTINPKILYRGLMPNMASMAPITALQVSTTELIKTLVKQGDQDSEISELCDLFSSCLGGALSASVSSPTELVMSQQKEKVGFITTALNLVKTEGAKSLRKGLAGTAARDSIFTGGYLFGVPFLEKKFKPYFSDTTASLGSGVVTGTGSALLSQPFDFLKTAQQTMPLNTTGKITPMWDIAKTVVKEKGIQALYQGGTPRTIRVISAVTLISKVNQSVKEKLGNKP